MIQQLYFSIQGRISRQFYWLFGVLPFAILGFILGIVLAVYELNPTLSVPFILVSLWPTLVMQVKRWHDFGQSGWLCLLSLIPYVGIVVWVVVGLIPGSKGENRFGPDPLVSVS